MCYAGIDCITEMQINQTLQNLPQTTEVRVAPRRPRWQRVRHAFFIVLALLVVAFSIGSQSLSSEERRARAISQTVSGLGFNLLEWEAESIANELEALVERPTAGLTPAESTELVRIYLERARRMAEIEWTIEQHLAEAQVAARAVMSGSTSSPDIAALQAELDVLRMQQEADRLTVEQIIQEQIGAELVAAGLQVRGQPFPPVLFGFVEPPKKMVVSPRDRIETIHAHMLDADTRLDTIQQIEGTIYREQNLSAYITNIGGLGAFPTMVIDRAGLDWILSTVAHEWTHNYLTLFPLGLNYMTSSDLTIINETVAEIVGNEIGAGALRRYYPDLVPPPPDPRAAFIREYEPYYAAQPPFDFRAEMRKTRLEVDRLLAEDRVAEAEAYMEERRQLFVENGYPLRVLNQAYFAFHGSYGTSAASSSPIGPKLERLRDLTPDLPTFLRTVRWFTSSADIDRALAEWGN